MTVAATLSGECTARFTRVAEVFAENWRSREELGAAVCVHLNGVKIVDLWGGHLDLERAVPWQRDTLVATASITKGMLALTVHGLADRGQIDLERPVAHYWPQFAQAGKEHVTVRQLISHHAGLIYPDKAPPGSLLDWSAMIEALAAQTPQWPPGTIGAYHSSTYGHLVGELVRRASGGRTFPQLFRELYAEPLGLDYHVVMGEEEIARVSDIHANPANTTMKDILDPSSKLGRAWRVFPPIPNFFNSRQMRTTELGSGSGHGNARSMSRLFAALARDGGIDGIRLLKPATVRTLRAEQWNGICGMTDRPSRMAMGLFLRDSNHAMGHNPEAFGHAGAGGRIVFADPVAKLAFAYTPNYMCAGDSLGERCTALIDATYQALGQRTPSGG